jgi:hypothetical protein
MIMNIMAFHSSRFPSKGNVNHRAFLNLSLNKSYNHRNRTIVSQRKLIVRQNGNFSQNLTKKVIAMKNFLLPVLVIFSMSFSYGYGLASSAEMDASGNIIHLSHDQYSVTYDGAAVNDVVGVFDPWYPTQDTTSGKFSFSLVYSKNGTYAINYSTGIVTISNTTNLKKGTDTLIVRTTLQGRTEDNYLFVTVKAAADCYFIDPSAGSNGNGTRNSPYNSWSNISFKAGKAYFQKRGTTNKIPIVIRTSGTSGNEVILGAYGTGNRPIINCGVNSIGMQVYAGYIWFFEYEYTNNLYGIETESGTADAYTYVHDLFSDLTFHHNVDNGQLYFKRRGNVGENDYFHRVYDINANYGQTYGMKIEGSQNIVENFRGYENEKMAISIPIWGDYNIISGLSTYNNGNNGMEMSGVGNEASYSYLKTEYRGIVVDDPGSAGTLIHHCLFEGSTGDASIKLRAEGLFWQNQVEMYSGKDVTIEDNVIRNNYYSAGISVEFAMKNTAIRRNKIYNNYQGILIGKANEGIDLVRIEYNVMYNNKTDISGIAGSTIYIYNNTCDGIIDCSGSTSETAQNNFYKTLTGVSTSSNNIDIDAINTGNFFTNYGGHDYTLKSTATSAIDKGIYVGLGSDIRGQSIINIPDIGAYEYVSGAEYINQAPSIDDQTFDISSENVESFSQKIIASDPENGQYLKYSIVSGNEDGIFNLGAQSGSLTCNADKMSFENTQTYTLRVMVSDYGSPVLSASADVKIIVYQYVNQAPVMNDQDFYISSENASSFQGKIVASDPDAGQTLSYAVATGNEEGIFNLNGSTGILTCNTNKMSFDKAMVYSMNVEVSDNGNPVLTDNSTISVHLSETINHAPVINDQEFIVTSENVSSFSKKITASDQDAGQTLKYTIISGNEAGIFSLNATSGIITCNAGKISFEKPVIYSFLVRATDNGTPNLSDSSTITVETELKEKTFYIDPTNQLDDIQNGTVEHPYSTWKQVTWVSGNTYLQKSGTVAMESKVNISASDVKVGSYGEGDQPVIQSNVNDFAIRAFEKSDILIEGMHIIASKAVSCIYFIGEGTDNITVKNCTFEGSVNGVRVLNAVNITICYNTFIKCSEAIYCYAEKSVIYYNIFKENDVAIDALGNLASSEIYNNVFYNNSLGISNSYSELTLYNNIFYMVSENSVAINNQMDRLVSDNNIFYPEREGFIQMESKSYRTLYEFQQDKSLDLNSFAEDPQFVDVYNSNFGLKAGSPAINRGKSVGLQEDFYGDAVPFGGLPDIGLVEWNYSVGSPTALPSIEDNSGQENMEVYPNPSHGIFNVHVKNENLTPSSIFITDLMGKTVFSNKYSSSFELSEQIDVSNLKQGIYIVVVESNSRSLSQTIIIN